MTVPRFAATLILGCALSACQAPTVKAATTTAAPSAAGPAAGSCHAVNGKADHTCTPGAINPQVTQDTIKQTICVSGWAKKMRPPEAVTEPQKKASLKAYGLPGPLSAYEFDHLIALTDGGSPDDPLNLWPEAYAGVAGAHAKDVEEVSLNHQVCAGKITLGAAQQKLIADWTHS